MEFKWGVVAAIAIVIGFIMLFLFESYQRSHNIGY
jgi:hypothetical protein